MSRPSERELLLAIYLAHENTHLGVAAVMMTFGLNQQRAWHEINEALRMRDKQTDFSKLRERMPA